MRRFRPFARTEWNREARRSRDILGHTSGSSAWPEKQSSAARHADAASRQLIEEQLRVREIGGVEALGEPAVDRREQLARFGPPALFAP
jgi:hypothetical protein